MRLHTRRRGLASAGMVGNKDVIQPMIGSASAIAGLTLVFLGFIISARSSYEADSSRCCSSPPAQSYSECGAIDVALTARENQSLIDIGLTQFFDKHRDDVIQALEPTLAIEPTLRTFLAGKKKREKYWPRRFGDYVLDQHWEELTSGSDEEDQDA